MPASIPSSTLEKLTTFGDLLRFLRRRAGLTQLELSFDVGYSNAQISRLEQNLRLPDLPTIENRFVAALGIKNEPELVTRLLELAGNVRREDVPAHGLCPYKGLNYFDEADADLFVGREALTAKLAEQVLSFTNSREGEKERFFAIVGASGSGKSSLVRAGLVPALRWNKPSANWPIHVLTPTTHPLESLAMSLTQDKASLTDTTRLIDDLARDRRSLDLFIKRELKRTGNAYLLLVIDQFEELFTLCRSEDERCSFLDNLLTAASGVDGRVIIVIALRADFYAHCAGYLQLREALARCQEYIGALSDMELRRAIEEPARLGRWEFELGLVDLILYDVGHEPGALPLLSHALLETWQRRHGRTMTLSGYTSSGGVRGAIAETAETVFVDQFTCEQQAIARRIFLRLTELGDETATGDTRRQAKFNELILNPEEAVATQVVLKALADARLITTSEDSAQVAHEALIREWPTLRGWLEDNREGLHLHRHLTEAAQEWLACEREPDMLYRGARLAQTREWAALHEEDINTQEREFLAASVAFAEKEATEREAQRQRELEAAQKLADVERQRAASEQRRAEEQTRAASHLRRRAVYLALALSASILLLLVAVWLGQLANRNAVTAQAQTRLASSRELASAAVSNLQIDQERSVLLALQAISTADTLEARNSIRRALPELHILRTIPAHLQSPGVAYSPDGKRLASIGIEGMVKIWDVASGQALLELPADPVEFGLGIAFSPDGKRVAVPWISQLVVWDAESGQRDITFPGDLTGGTVNRASFSPDSQRVAVANLDGLPRVWDLDSGIQVFALSGHEQLCDAIAFSPDGKQIATGDQGGTIKIWDAANGQELLSFGSGGVIHNLAYSPDGAQLAAANEDGTLIIWDPTTGQEALSLPRMSGLYSVAFMPDGKRLVTAHQDGTTKMWNAVSGQLLLTLAGHVSTVVDVACSPDGKQIATAGFDGTIRQWDTSPGREVLTLAAHTDQAYEVRYSPDGSQLATVGMDGYARIWEARTGQLALELAPGSPLTSLAYSPDGKLLAAGGVDGMVYAWDLDTGKLILQDAGHHAMVPGVAFSPDGTRLVSGSWDATAIVWEVSTGRKIASFGGHTIGFGVGIAFSPDGKTVYSSGADSYGRQWEADTGQQVAEYYADGREIYGLAVSPDGRLLALGLHDGDIDIWDTIQNIKIYTLTGHAGINSRLAFSQDGTRLASANFDGLAKVWDVQNGQELFTLYGNPSNLFGVAFSPDGSRLATAGGDGTLRIFTMDMNELVALARSRLTRSLTISECQKYLHVEQCPAWP
jgi:WD40 repeat protein/transcriptional regulator with XRE-family HTH domain